MSSSVTTLLRRPESEWMAEVEGPILMVSDLDSEFANPTNTSRLECVMV
jgi:hypothetical protein